MIMKTVLKILAALAAIAGAIYVLATYGDKLVAWSRKLLSTICWEDCCCGDDCGCDHDHDHGCECGCDHE